jgi:UDP-N-acetylmuramate--alanine ligase
VKRSELAIRQLPSPPAHVHFIGIGGIGMSGLARILHAGGYRVTGSDSNANQVTGSLISEGIPVSIGHDALEDAGSAEVVIITAAVTEANPELRAARDRSRPVLKRAELLGLLASERLCIAVAGSHGKSSTSGMLTSALIELGADPSYAVGAILAATDLNAAAGSGPHMVVEADEYDRSFLTLEPDVAVITNVDYDHPDLFESQQEYDQLFVDFIALVKEDGLLIYAGDDPGMSRVMQASTSGESVRVMTFSEQAGLDWQLSGQHPSWTLRAPNGDMTTFRLNVPGRHNARNAAAAIATIVNLGYSLSEAVEAVSRYRGIGRRFELKGEACGITVIDDYAHHPTEITATIAAAREQFPDRRIITVFQPHTFSRTRTLLDDFASVLRAADRVVLLDIYAARETDDGTVSSDNLAMLIGTNVIRTHQPADTVETLADDLQAGDVVLTIGAGSVTDTGPLLLQRISRQRQP